MSKKIRNPALLKPAAGATEGITELRRQETLLITGALQNAILNSANFSSIATDEKGVIQIFNVGAERMLGYTAADVLNKVTPADITDPQEVIARAAVWRTYMNCPISARMAAAFRRWCRSRRCATRNTPLSATCSSARIIPRAS